MHLFMETILIVNSRMRLWNNKSLFCHDSEYYRVRYHQQAKSAPKLAEDGTEIGPPFVKRWRRHTSGQLSSLFNAHFNTVTDEDVAI